MEYEIYEHVSCPWLEGRAVMLTTSKWSAQEQAAKESSYQRTVLLCSNPYHDVF